MISKKCAVISLSIIILLSSFLAVSVKCMETFSTDPIASTSFSTVSVSQQNDHILVLTMDPGVKQICYSAFDLSSLPEDATPISCRFKIQCAAISEICHISAFCSPDADWIGKSLTWETKPERGDYVSSNWIDIMKDWYSYESESLNNNVKRALNNDGLLSVSLSTGIGDVSQHGIIGFYPDAVLEVDYVIGSKGSSMEDTEVQIDEIHQSSSENSRMLSDVIMILFLVAVIVVGLALIMKWRK
ncbi:MAG: hypothetical protein ACOWW1_06390 [archaeon]